MSASAQVATILDIDIVGADDTTVVGDGSSMIYTSVPDCDDTGGQHLNYDTGTNALSCGTSSATETDPTLTDDCAVTVGDGSCGDVTVTFDGDAGTDGPLVWDVSEDSFLISTWASGNHGEYDLTCGGTYGGFKLGNVGIYSSSFSASNLDLDKAVLFRQEGNIGVGNDPGIEFAWMEQGNTIRMAIPESGADNATAFIRSGTFAGPYTAAVGNDIVSCDQWTTYDSNIDCDTSGTGADLFVQDDLEVEGTIYAHETLALEGATADGNQQLIGTDDPSADRTFNLPDDALADDDVLMGDGAGSVAYAAVPDCDDSGGNHLNYDTTTNAWSCGTSSSGSAGSAILGASAASNYLLAAKGTTVYASADGSETSSTEADARYYVPVTGTLQNFRVYVRVNGGDGASDPDSYVTLRLNGVDTALAITISPGVAGVSLDASTVAISAGDYITVEIENNNTGGGAKDLGLGSWSVELAQ